MTSTAALCLALLAFTACAAPAGTLPRPTYWHGYRGAIPEPAAAMDGGTFVYGLVFHDGTTATSATQHESFALCERERTDYAALATERVKDGAAPVMTVKCHRAHETGVMQTR